MEFGYFVYLCKHIREKRSKMRKIISLLLATLLITSCVSKQRRERMERLLSKAEEMNQNYVPMDTVKFMDEVVSFYSSHGNREEKMRANYMMGCVYRDRGDAPMALQYYNDAVSEADTTQETCDYRQLSRIYGQMAFIFDEQRTTLIGIKMWKMANRYALLAKDTLAAITYYERIGESYSILGNDSLCLSYTQKAYKAYTKHGWGNYAAGALATTIDTELKQKKYTSAKKHIDFFIRYSGIFDEKGNIAIGRELFYESLGNYYEGIHNNDSALYFYRKLLSYPTNTMCMENGYKGMLSVYEKLAKPDSVLKYARLYADANDSAVVAHSGEAIIKMQNVYNYNNHQRQATIMAQRASRLWKTVCCMIVLAFLFMMVIFVISHRYKNSRKQLMLANRQYSDTLYQYHQLQQDLHTMTTNINEYKKEKELEIAKLEKTLAGFQDDGQAEKIDAERMLLSHPAIKRMHDLAAHIQVPTEAAWEALKETVCQMLPDFYAKIHSANLTDKEIGVCILVRLSFTSSEMVILFDLTKQRISNLRSSINQKLFQISGTAGLDAHIRRL